MYYLKILHYRSVLILIVTGMLCMFGCGGGEQIREDGYTTGSAEDIGGTGSKTVTVEGLAEVRAAGLADAYDRAEDAAKTKAVEKVLGTIFDARVIGSSGVILEETIYAKKAGYIKKSERISQREEGGIAYITIKAEVGLQKLKDDVMGLDILQKRMNMPNTVIFIKEYSLGKLSKQKAAYNTIVTKFREKKFNIISPSQISSTFTRKLSALYKYLDSDSLVRWFLVLLD